MSDSDEKDIKFRDECAAKILQSLLLRKDADRTLNTIIENYKSETYQDWVEMAFEDVETLARVSYRIADIMRKVRLTSFE